MLRQIHGPNAAPLQMTGVSKSYDGELKLNNASLEVNAGEFVLITGPSGSGKTTMLDIAQGILTPDSGSVVLGGEELYGQTGDNLSRIRAEYGHSFQKAALLGGLSVGHNIQYPHQMTGNRIDSAWANQVCERLGIDGLYDQMAGTLSGGQAMRVAVARGLVHSPDVFFADEPTAALDTASKHNVLGILKELTSRRDIAVAMVSHDEIAHEYADRVVHLQDGVIVGETTPDTAIAS